MAKKEERWPSTFEEFLDRRGMDEKTKEKTLKLMKVKSIEEFEEAFQGDEDYAKLKESYLELKAMADKVGIGGRK